jgi:PAS domain S-box-containing protein
MKKVTYFGLWLLFFLLEVTGFSQHYNIKNYSREEGLAQSQVRSIYQDSNGYLWIGTSGGGVSKFDGISFINFTTKDGLVDNYVLAIFEDSNRNLWFGTKEGVSRYDGMKFHPLDAGNGLNNSVVQAILQDRAGNVWFGTEQGAWKYDGKTFYHVTGKDGLANDTIMSMLVDSEGNIWFGTGGGVSRYDGGGFTHFSTADGLPASTIDAILEDQNGNLWLGTYSGACKYDGKTFRTYTVDDGLSSHSIMTIIEDRDGNLWFGTSSGGICKFDGKVFTCITEENGLSSNVVWALLEDREGNIWIGTYRGGLDKYSGDAFTYYSSKDSLADDVIRAILEDRQGNLWFATFRGGVSKFDGKSMTTFSTKDGLIDNFVLTIYEDREGNLWFGTFGGVSKYDGKQFVNITREDGLPDSVVRSIIEDRARNIWFGTNEGGISRYDGKTVTNFTIEDGLNVNQISTIMEDKEGGLWIATSNGICHYDGKTFTNISKKFALKQTNIYSIIQGEKGSVWFGAYGDGIIKHTPHGSFEVFSSKDGLDNDNVVSMGFDDGGKLWIGTEKGICQLDAPLYEKTGQKKFKHYGKEEGFVGIECIHNSICKDRHGNIWFGTIKGAIKYKPYREKPNFMEPLTHITDIRLLSGEDAWFAHAEGISSKNGLPIGLKLPFNKNYLVFDFIAVSLTVPEKVKYQYKLEGFDDRWVPVSEGSYANYSNIPPGRYVFKVKACNNEGIWNKVPTSFDFEILPPFWMTWWFYLLCGVFVVSGIYTFIKIRIRSLVRHRRILKEKVRSSTLELKKEKEKVEQINLELESRVRERTAELVELNRSLEEEITERNVVEEALVESEVKFRLVVENANVAIFIAQDDVVEFPNPRAVQMFGYSTEELAKIPFSQLIHPEDKNKFLVRHSRSLEGEEFPGTYSFRVVTKANNQRWVDLNSVSIQWEGKPATLNFFMDITEKKRLESQLLEAQKMKAIGTMAGGIAHDFNNLLMGILGNVSLILSEIGSSHAYHEELSHVEELVQHGVSLTRQLLGFARGGKYEVTVTDLNRIMQRSSDMFSHTRKEITIHQKCKKNLWTVEVDQGQIEQVLMNLYVNAWQAMPGGGEIYLQTENLTIDESTAESYGLKPGNYVKVSITDTGAGMDEETRQRIFEPFFTTKEMGRGTGLGLASVYGIIKNHGGSIQVYSEKGKGTTFNIYLPASEKELVKEKKRPGKYLKGTETILLVDDEKGIAEIGEKLLKKMGYTVFIAGSGKEAIEIYEENKEKIDLVILDLIMPVMGGGETFAQLKKMNPGIKVLLSSGYSLNGQASEILKNGCKGFIQKPFTLRELSQKVRSVLDS